MVFSYEDDGDELWGEAAEIWEFRDSKEAR
jgi:hypothetical protein